MTMSPTASTDAKKTNFLDLPNETIVEIFKYLNRSNGLKLCLNRRLENLYNLKTYSFKKLEIELYCDFCFIAVNQITENRFRRDNYDELARELHRLALNTAIDEVVVDLQSHTSDDHDRLFEAIFQLNAKKLNICSTFSSRNLISIPQLNIANILLCAQHIGALTVSNRIDCNSISLEDLCMIHKKMAEDCKLEMFDMPNMDGLSEFLDLRFGILLEITPGRSKIFRGANSSVKIYSYDRHMLDLAVCDGTIKTNIEENRITFIKTNIEPASNLYKIKLNHRYDY